ncbi:hypothetical protein COV20_04040 [Candidatus Woesearchaeota archaeon CG10_big_fil_rev_8_21_14_0_10_45_16]|nr:MAG: hypothetical protein COV20_04040 [Candidatus Woesearchaeota archaeon CG10_big_fil_rev_8_21_14_0_10_45_16]
MSSRSKKILGNLAIFIVGIIIIFSIAEITVRVFKQDELAPGLWPEENTRYVPELKRNLYVNISNLTRSTSEYSYQVSTNEQGFRDFHPILKDEETTRILGLGSSQTFGNTVDADDTYLSLLGNELDVETINLGLGGIGLDEMKIILQEYGFSYQPDLIIVETSLGNFQSGSDFAHKSEASRETKNSAFFWLYEHSKLVNHLYWLSKTTHLGSKVVNTLKLNEHTQDSVSFELSLLRGDDDPTLYEAKKSVFRNLQEIKKLADEKEVPLMVVFVSSSYQVEPKRLQALVEKFGLAEEDVNPENAENFFRESCKRLNIPFFETTAALQDHQKGTPVIWNFDNHLTPRGNQIYASELAKFIKEHHLIER